MRIRIKDGYFVDDEGRQILLHGVNMVCKDKSRNYIGDWGKEDFSRLQKWGMNVIRLGVNWDGLEPSPGKYDDHYIEEVRRLVQLAHTYHLLIILDMHQDLYSSQFGNGAPAWATITGGETFESKDKWSDAYLFDPAVQKAFDHFWNNTPGPGGIGIQDRFANAWGYLAGKLNGEPNMIGYDIFNEPFIGSPVHKVNELMFGKYAELYTKRYGEIDLEQLFAIWQDPEKKQESLSLLDELESFKQVADAPGPIVQPFERSTLSAFYSKVGASIRKSDVQGILFLETNYFANVGTRSEIQPVVNEKGERDANQAYAPHGYNLVTDTDLAHMGNDQQLDFIFGRHEQTRNRLEMPMVIGEWGAFYDSAKTGHTAMEIQRIFEKLMCSDTYWSYTPEMDTVPSFLSICRGYPVAVAGLLMQYRYEHSLGSFHMKWEEEKAVDSPTIVYLPDIRHVTKDNVVLYPEGSPYSIRAIAESDAGFLEIPAGHGGIRSLVVVGAGPC